MPAFLTRIITSGRATGLAWGALLAGIGSLAWYAHGEHQLRQSLQANATPGVATPDLVALLRETNRERQTAEHKQDSLQLLLNQCQGRESLTYLNYLNYQRDEAKRIDSARSRAASMPAAQQQRKLAKRYPAPPAGK